ncbi:MAG: c-type cytochrome domain-containing protein, partial [Verrucomicrobiota bacterium]
MKQRVMNQGFQGAVPFAGRPVGPVGPAGPVGLRFAAALAAALLLSVRPIAAAEVLDARTRALFDTHCLDCHSTEKHKGDLDLERLVRTSAGATEPKVWQQVLEQVSLGEMPPKDRPAMDERSRDQLMSGVRAQL